MSEQIENPDKEEDDFMKEKKKPSSRNEKIIAVAIITIICGAVIWWNAVEFGTTYEKNEKSVNTTTDNRAIRPALPRPPKTDKPDKVDKVGKTSTSESADNEAPAGSGVGGKTFTEEEIQAMIAAAVKSSDIARAGGDRVHVEDRQQAIDASRASGEMSVFTAPAEVVNAANKDEKSRAVSKLINMSFTVPIGAVIPCTLVSEINTSAAGYAQCLTSAPVYGADGLVVLIDAGSTVTGSYLAGAGSNNSGRVVIAWNRIRTPAGVLVDIPSGNGSAIGVGRLGAAGHKAVIDSRYMERLKGAGMLSAFRLALGSFSVSSQQTGSDEKRSSPEIEGLMNSIIRENIMLPAIATIKHGDDLGIYVSDDIDFSTVYDLEAVVNQ